MRHDSRKWPGHAEVITATEIAYWVYCPEQCRLQYAAGAGTGEPPGAGGGQRHHSRKAWAEQGAGMFIALDGLPIATEQKTTNLQGTLVHIVHLTRRP